MIPVVFDTSTVVAAVFWPRSTARRCWAPVARREARPAITDEIANEYLKTCLEIQVERFPERSPSPFLGWIEAKALHCVPAPLGKRRSRDSSDDPFLACALTTAAPYIVSSDRDLLVLGKPFGIAIVTPMEFIKRMA